MQTTEKKLQVTVFFVWLEHRMFRPPFQEKNSESFLYIYNYMIQLYERVENKLIRPKWIAIQQS